MINTHHNFRHFQGLLLGLIVCLQLVSCTTLKERNQKIKVDFKTINWVDGINPQESLIILRHYVHIQNEYYGVRYLYPDKPLDAGDRWQYVTEFKNSSYERNPDQELTIFITKLTGKVSTKTSDGGLGSNKIKALVRRFENVKVFDGINRQEAVDILKHHYYVEAKNRYWMYKLDLLPTEGKRYWIFELKHDIQVSRQNKKKGKQLKKIEGLYLVVNRKTGELTKERSFLKLIR